jgi:putative nucleotidyltransferase with HDIG domain
MKKEETIQKIYSKVDEIPTLPSVIPRLVSALEEPSTTAQKVARLISEDPALTANVLKVANSAYYGFPGKIGSIEHAVMLLGFNMVRALTLSVGVINTVSEMATGFSQEALWLHSIRVATSMEELSSRYHRAAKQRDYIFIIGLLHDIGKLIFADLFPEQYRPLFVDENGGDRGEFYRNEVELFGIDHAEAGALLLKRWHFPEVIWFPIEAHHRDEIPEGNISQVVSLLRVADRVALNLGSLDEICPEDCKAELENLQLQEDALFQAAQFLEESEDRIRSFYESFQ